jgi:putative DNA primase/helicase
VTAPPDDDNVTWLHGRDQPSDYDKAWLLKAYRGDIDTDDAARQCAILRALPEMLDRWPEAREALEAGDFAHPDDKRRFAPIDFGPPPDEPYEVDHDAQAAFDALVASNGQDTDRYTDTGNAHRFAAANRHRVRWVGAWGVWLIWDDRRWRQDTKGQVVEFAKQVAVRLLGDAQRLESSDERKRAAKWALQTEGAARIKAMLELARSEPGLPVDPHELDANPWLLNVANGTLDLRHGKLRAHTPSDLITKLAPVAYDADADAPLWHRFLRKVVPDSEVRRFLQHWCGYCLTGDVSEHKIVFAHGVGANGKSTFSETLEAMLGDYATQAAPDLLMRRHDDPHPTGLADLHGARLVLATETAEGRRLDEALVKRLTGGDPIKARRMHKDFFTFTPTHKFVVGTNHRPTIEGTDHGIWRRVRLVPFTVTIADDDQDKQLKHKLAGELAGILNWALDGCQAWREDGLTEPGAVTAATADYRSEMDELGQYLSDLCVLAEGVTARAADLYKAYTHWAQEMGERRPLNQRRFGLALRERGLTKRTSNGVWWDGISLRALDHSHRDPTEPSAGSADPEPSLPDIERF